MHAPSYEPRPISRACCVAQDSTLLLRADPGTVVTESFAMPMAVAGPYRGTVRTVQGPTLNRDELEAGPASPLNSVSQLGTPLGGRKHPLSPKPQW